MTELDYLSTIGYQGDLALSSKSLRKAYQGKDAKALAEAGYFKAAIGAILSQGKDEAQKQEVLAAYNKGAAKQVESFERLRAIFGVDPSPEAIKKTLDLNA